MFTLFGGVGFCFARHLRSEHTNATLRASLTPLREEVKHRQILGELSWRNEGSLLHMSHHLLVGMFGPQGGWDVGFLVACLIWSFNVCSI